MNIFKELISSPRWGSNLILNMHVQINIFHFHLLFRTQWSLVYKTLETVSLQPAGHSTKISPFVFWVLFSKFYFTQALSSIGPPTHSCDTAHWKLHVAVQPIMKNSPTMHFVWCFHYSAVLLSSIISPSAPALQSFWHGSILPSQTDIMWGGPQLWLSTYPPEDYVTVQWCQTLWVYKYLDTTRDLLTYRPIRW